MKAMKTVKRNSLLVQRLQICSEKYPNLTAKAKEEAGGKSRCLFFLYNRIPCVSQGNN